MPCDWLVNYLLPALRPISVLWPICALWLVVALH